MGNKITFKVIFENDYKDYDEYDFEEYNENEINKSKIFEAELTAFVLKKKGKIEQIFEKEE
jgi:hypothetical protein